MTTTDNTDKTWCCNNCRSWFVREGEARTCPTCIDELRGIGAWCDVHGALWQEPVFKTVETKAGPFSVCVGTKGPEECPACAEIDRGYQRLYRDVQMERLRDSLAAAYEDHYGPYGGAA